MITADGGDGEGVSGQCVDFGGRELGIEIEDVGAIGPFDVAVVRVMVTVSLASRSSQVI